MQNFGWTSERRNHYEDIGVDGTIILKLVLGKWSWRVWIGLMWLTTGSADGLL
jgi:hypothetical protein